jgi:hypothetical protein
MPQYDVNQTPDTGDLVEHTGFQFRKFAYLKLLTYAIHNTDARTSDPSTLSVAVLYSVDWIDDK